jgi:hypothetical protein
VKHPAALALALLVWSGLAAPAAAQAPDPFPCSLVTRLEVEAVQKDKVTDAKASEPSREPLAVSQCFYSAKTFSRSVSLEVTRRPAGGKESPAAHWKQMFARAFERSRAKEKEEEEEKAAAARRRRRKKPPRSRARSPVSETRPTGSQRRWAAGSMS